MGPSMLGSSSKKTSGLGAPPGCKRWNHACTTFAKALRMDGVIFSRVLPGQRALKDFVVLEDIAEDARNHLKTLNGIAVNGIPSATSMAAALTLHKLSLRVSEVVVGDKFKLDLLMFSEGKVPQMTSHDQWLQYSTMLLGTKR